MKIGISFTIPIIYIKKKKKTCFIWVPKIESLLCLVYYSQNTVGKKNLKKKNKYVKRPQAEIAYLALPKVEPRGANPHSPAPQLGPLNK